ncbi:MAG: PEP/pyruvate-binding domain-containing protein [Planctomycetaceae bacterium]
MPPYDSEETLRRLEGYLASYPALRGRVCRILLLHLHSHGHVRIEDVYRRAERAAEWAQPADLNRPSSRLWGADEKEEINKLVIQLAADHLRPAEVEELVWSAHRRDEAQSLEALARMPDVSLDLIADKAASYAALTIAHPGEQGSAPEGTRVALIRRFISERVDFIAVAKQHIRVRDMGWVLDRIINSDPGRGTIGGKAAGMLLARCILQSADCGPVQLPESAFLMTDAYNEFKQVNGLTHLEYQKYKPIEEIRDDYPAIRDVFRNAEWPTRIVDLLRAELDRWGERPLIVRSSSLLEDNFGAAFSGIYRSLFVPNRGDLATRLQELLGAIAEIYAGIFHPDAIQYRRTHELLDYDERMAVMIQQVVGARHGRYFLPAFAGVAFSRNEHRWNRRLRREDGLMRLVLGLGTHAVDRVGDYARMVPLGAPTQRPEATPDEIVRSSQKFVDVVDLEGAGFRTVPVAPVLEAMRGAGIADFVSIRDEEGRIAPPVATRLDEPAERLCVTFDRLLARGEFPRRMQIILKSLEEAYGCPVDVEFAVQGEDLYILQCRPLGAGEPAARALVPPGVPEQDKIFSATRYVSNGALPGIEYVVLIDPRDYQRAGGADRRLRIARAVGHINDALAGKRFILMGPGRWGSQDVLLGVQVSYADICHAQALIEIARASEGYVPEPSFGTHFFQDLLEASIRYLPLFPDDPGAVFNDAFLLNRPNALRAISPRDASLADIVRVIDVKAACPDRSLDLVMDGEAQQALCYLA